MITRHPLLFIDFKIQLALHGAHRLFELAYLLAFLDYLLSNELHFFFVVFHFFDVGCDEVGGLLAPLPHIFPRLARLVHFLLRFLQERLYLLNCLLR